MTSLEPILIAAALAIGAPPTKSPAPAAKAPASEKTAADLPRGFVPLERRAIAPSLDDASFEKLLEALSQFQWSRAVRVDTDPLSPRCPFEHAALRLLIERARQSSEARAAIVAGLRRARRTWLEDRLIAPLRQPLDKERELLDLARSFHASLALAYLDDSVGLQELDRKLRDERAAVIERTAAAFALAQWPKVLDARALRGMLAATRKAQSKTQGADGERPTPHDTEHDAHTAGLLWAMIQAEQLDPAYDPSTDPDLRHIAERGGELSRRVAAVAFRGRAWESIPDLLASLLDDPSERVRRAALAALAEHPTVAAAERVRLACRDRDISVRALAISRLARFPGPETTRLVRELSLANSPREREQAVLAAAPLGLADVVAAGIDDKTELVRKAAAKALGETPGVDAARTLADMLADRSLEVHKAVVSALERRPVGEAVPGLLKALASPSLRTREQAALALERVWPAAGSFPCQARPEDRAQRLELLERQWTATPAHSAVAQASAPAESTRIRRLLSAWHRAPAEERETINKELIAVGPSAIAEIEQALHAWNSYPHRLLVQEVLGQIDPLYRFLGQVDEGGGAETAAIGSALAALERRRLTAGQAAFLAESLVSKKTAAAWVALAPLLERDAPSESARLDTRGLEHPDARVREATLARLSSRPSHSLGLEVASRWKDENPLVRIAAYRAAARARPLPDLGELVGVLRQPDPRERLAAACTLLEVVRPEGLEELRRLLFHESPTVRRQMVRELATLATKNPRTVLPLLAQALADNKLEVQEEAVRGLERVTGIAYSMDTSGRRVPLDRQIGQWKKSLHEFLTGSASPRALGRLAN